MHTGTYRYVHVYTYMYILHVCAHLFETITLQLTNSLSQWIRVTAILEICSTSRSSLVPTQTHVLKTFPMYIFLTEEVS